MANRAEEADWWDPALAREARLEQATDREQFSEEICDMRSDRMRALMNQWSMKETGDPYLPDYDDEEDEP